LRLTPIVAFATALGLCACGSSRDDVPPWMRPAEKPRDENYRGGPVAILLHYDVNHDGVLERKELEAGLKAEFAAADARHTGCLDDDQVAAINQKRQDADKSTATPLIDWNRDGCIDYREFSAAPISLFDQLDRNGDSKLTKQEMGQKTGAEPAGQPGAGAGEDEKGTPEGRQRGPRGGAGGEGPRSDHPGGPPAAVPK